MKEISTEQIEARLGSENPWWSEPHKISEAYSAYEPRAYLDLYMPLIANGTRHRAVVLLGPRRVGKTVMIHHAIQLLLADDVPSNKILYCSIDNPIYNGLSLEQILDRFSAITGTNLRKDKAFVFFDEIQYLKEWERHLKSLVDTRGSLRICVSGSAAAALKLKSQESGAGRFTNFLLPPLTFYEYLKLLKRDDLVSIISQKGSTTRQYKCDKIDALNDAFVQYINFGGYPEIALTPELQSDPSRYIKSDIIDKVLLRDLPSLYGIQDIQELNYLFTTLAFNSANEVSLESLSQSSGVAKNTIKRYIEYLEAAFLIRTVHRVDRNAKRFKRANFFKVYLTNPSIRSALFAPIKADDEAMGDLVETAVYSQWFHSDVTTLHYARWGNGEVDIVSLDAKQRLRWAMEVKWSDRYCSKTSELKSMYAFCHANNLKYANVTTMTKTMLKTYQNIEFFFRPASLYAFAVGANLIRSKHKRLDADLIDDIPKLAKDSNTAQS
jgi:uncharacterized protein